MTLFRPVNAFSLNSIMGLRPLESIGASPGQPQLSTICCATNGPEGGGGNGKKLDSELHTTAETVIKGHRPNNEVQILREKWLVAKEDESDESWSLRNQYEDALSALPKGSDAVYKEAEALRRLILGSRGHSAKGKRRYNTRDDIAHHASVFYSEILSAKFVAGPKVYEEAVILHRMLAWTDTFGRMQVMRAYSSLTPMLDRKFRFIAFFARLWRSL